MYLKRLHITQYKNFEYGEFDFDAKINCLVGDNGTGKTNILDAVYHLSQTKSYFNPVNIQNIRHGEGFFIIEGIFEKDGTEDTIVCSYRKNNKKVVKRNGKEYERFSEHIGVIPVVIISPYDRDLIVENAERRRKFTDHVISQSDKEYLLQLIQYNKVLAQRNALLKYFAKNRTFDPDTLDVLDDQLHTYSVYIHRKRKEFAERIEPLLKEYYAKISGGDEEVGLRYKSRLNTTNLRELLKENLQRDRLLQHTSSGIHRDDMEFLIDGEYPIKKFGSQGQQKSYLIALKMAQFDLLKSQSGAAPILLLDDIFDKLDDSRVSRLIGLVNKDRFGQIFISDTHPERTEVIVAQTGQSYKMIHLK